MESHHWIDPLISITIAGGLCGFLLMTTMANGILEITPDGIVNLTVLWIASLVGGYLFQIANISLLGSLLVGILLRHVFNFSVDSWFADFVRSLSLCVILLMSSVEIDIDKIRRLGFVCMRLTSIPGLCEAVVTSLIAVWAFGMSFTLALALGFLLAAVSPAILVPGVMRLKEMGYGIDKGIPSLVMAAASFDDITAITGFTASLGIALDNSSNNMFLSILIHGPFQLFLGVASGCLLSILLVGVWFSPRQWQRTLIAIEIGIITTFTFKKFHMDGVGAGR